MNSFWFRFLFFTIDKLALITTNQLLSQQISLNRLTGKQSRQNQFFRLSENFFMLKISETGKLSKNRYLHRRDLQPRTPALRVFLFFYESRFLSRPFRVSSLYVLNELLFAFQNSEFEDIIKLTLSSSSKSSVLQPTHSPLSTVFFHANVPAFRFFLHFVLVAPFATNFSPLGQSKRAFFPLILTLIPSGIVRSDWRQPEASVKAFQVKSCASLN